MVFYKENCRWGDGYFTKWVKDRFPQLKLGKKQKRTDLFRLLMEIGLIERIEKGSQGRPSIWKVGEAYRSMFLNPDMATDVMNEPDLVNNEPLMQ